MEEFDNIFRENVKKAFNSYNADNLADEGWDSFVRVGKGRKRRSLIIPLWARAASVLLMVGLATFLSYRIFTRQNSRELISDNETPVMKLEQPKVQSEKAGTPLIEPSAESEFVIENKIAETGSVYSESIALAEPLDMDNENILTQLSHKNRVPVPEKIRSHYIPRVSDELRKQLIPEEIAITDEIPGDLIAEEKKEKHFKERTFMAGLSGLSAQNSDKVTPAFGLSAGLYLDQKLSRRISVRPGLALAMQSLGFNNGSIPVGITEVLSMYDGTNAAYYSSEGQLNMLAMELPLNIVFRIADKKNSVFFISAGTSTMIYLSQQFTAGFVSECKKTSYDSKVGEYFSETRYSTVEVENDYAALSRADIFGLANFSAGYSFQYSKTGTLLIEPFLQVPVSDLTSLNLRVRYAGVSMKMQFGKKPREY